jgi:glycosyltransferase involved in cell wall biosynthesis
MRILIVNSEHPPLGGGAGNASANLGKKLVEFGDDVTILTCSHGDYPRTEIEDGVRIRRVVSIRKNVSSSSPFEQLTFMLGAVVEGLSFINNWKPDVIITFFGIPSGPVGLVGKMLFGIPYIVSLRGGDVPGFRTYDFGIIHKISSPFLKVIWKQAGAVVANSQGLKKLASSFNSDIPCQVITNGVNLDFFQSKRLYSDDLHLLFVGRLVYQKGLDLLLKALANLNEYPWQLSIVGDGPQRDTLQDLAVSLGMRDRIHFLGWNTHEELKNKYQEASIFVFPSRDEGMPNAVLEAMASGLPVIASNISGNEELIQDDITGLLVPRDNWEMLQEKLKILMIDNHRREQLGRAARKRAEELFSWDQIAQQYKDLILSIIS